MPRDLPMVLGERCFSLEDQIAFASFSGDWNPIHVDPIYARRCLTGQAVVHGMHMLLWVLELWAPRRATSSSLASIKVQFFKPGFLGERLVCRMLANHGDSVQFEVYSSAGQSILIDCLYRAEVSHRYNIPVCTFNNTSIVPLELSIDELGGRDGGWELLTKAGQAELLFPDMVAMCGSTITVVLANLSRLVGMECPGLNSLFSELDIALDESLEPCNNLHYQVERVDRRFQLVTTKFRAAGYSGFVKTFVRPSPSRQADMRSIRNDVLPDAFVGQRALIVGGSRGLGELTAKLLASGGADVCLTYNQGAAEAADVVRDITGNGGRATAVALDVRQPIDIGWRAPQGWAPTHLYYFATPFIFSGQRAGFSFGLYAKLNSYYVEGFAQIVGALVSSGLSAAFYPSTVALDESPSDMAEYCAAKGAGEALCQVLLHRHRDLRIACPRLPRLATDQTASLLPVENTDPRGIIRDLLLEFSCMHESL